MEQRNYWGTPEVYNTMSPFMNAERPKEVKRNAESEKLL
jgi:hypothetical protein